MSPKLNSKQATLSFLSIFLFVLVLYVLSYHFTIEANCINAIPVSVKPGKKPTKLRAQSRAMRVDKWIAKQSVDSWKRVAIRDTTKGKLIVDILHRKVWVWDGKEKQARKWHLVVRRERKSPSTIKYSFSNAPSGTSFHRLAYMQAQRYWVERPFQDAKNQCGMGDYQARGWLAWHHHMSMVMFAMLFLLEQRLNNHARILVGQNCPA